MHVMQEIEELTLDLQNKPMRRLISFLPLLILLISPVHAQPFEQGDNEPNSQKNRDEIALLKQQVAGLTERLDGVTTLIEGFNGVIQELKQPKQSPLLEETQMRFDVLEAKVALLSKGNLSELPDSDNETNQSKKKEEPKIEPKKEPVSKLSTIPTSKLYSQGVRLFLKHKYSDAEERFTITKTKNYKPAASNYYLGEIAYSTHKYSNAISYFKKSIQLYDEASYNDMLLLHTAISLEKIGDKEQAKNFYQTLIQSYPDASTASIAKENLKKL